MIHVIKKQNVFAISILCFFFALSLHAYSQAALGENLPVGKDSMRALEKQKALLSADLPTDTTNILQTIPYKTVKYSPNISVQQYIKGNASAAFVKEDNGEPGAEQFMYLRGLSTPLFTKQDLYAIQPVVYINGFPLVQENGFSYNIQRYDFNKIGSGTNLLSAIDINDIESIQVLKTPSEIASLGPLATNGAIWITTKKAKSGFRQFNFDTYVGMLQAPAVYTTNSTYEYEFRKKYYDKYATVQQAENMPVYLKNTEDVNYYGASNWTDVYYRSKPIYYVGFGIIGGKERSNFLFNISDTKGHNFDNTTFDRYALRFGINMQPFNWLTISSSISAARIDRQRNRSLRDRFAETRFVPDLTNPISPYAENYTTFLRKYRGAIDENKNNVLQGGLHAIAKFGRLELSSQISVDYEESIRDIFWGRPLLDNNSFLSSYYGITQRLSLNNKAKYNFDIGSNKQNNMLLEFGQGYNADFNKYDYVYGYNTPNDFIKIKEIYFNNNAYHNRYDIFAYPFSDKLNVNLASLYGRIRYTYKQLFQLDVSARNDGYSSFAPESRWLLTPMVSSRLNIHSMLKNEFITTLALRASWGVFGKLIQDNRFKIGPQYRVDLGYGDEPTLATYAGLTGLSQSYSFGWVNKFYNWPFAEKFNVGTDIGVMKDRFLFGIDFYQNTDKNMIVPVPLPAENGFEYKYVQGMNVKNTGINTEVVAHILQPATREQFSVTLYGNFNYNKNKLTQLPYNLKELVYGNRKIAIGMPVDSYWLYENKGIINTVNEIPKGNTNPDGSINNLTYSDMIDFAPGDAIWSDVNKDGTINSKDKVLKGHLLPVYQGGFGSNIGYNKFSLDLQFFYALGHQLLNQSTSNKLDFINTENSKNITYIKEITFWQKTFDYNAYPMYNPWSSTMPYRMDQDLFLENAGFLKLRSATLGYDLSGKTFLRKYNFSKATVYITGSNLFTFTSFKGGDPEMTDYNGVYTGRNLPIPKNYIIGLKLKF